MDLCLIKNLGESRLRQMNQNCVFCTLQLIKLSIPLFPDFSFKHVSHTNIGVSYIAHILKLCSWTLFGIEVLLCSVVPQPEGILIRLGVCLLYVHPQWHYYHYYYAMMIKTVITNDFPTLQHFLFRCNHAKHTYTFIYCLFPKLDCGELAELWL